jgi:lipoprotein-releasing system ATP-binding protein
MRNGEMIFELIGELHRSHNLTSILVTHNWSFARRCDRALLLEGGRLHPLPAGE